jgi:hypothetical protein
MALEEANEWICSTVDVEGGIRPGSKIKPVMRGVAAKDLRWNNGQTLKICFLNGDQNQRQNFMDIANLWIVDGVSLKLAITNDKKESNVRVKIGGEEKPVNKSLIGKESMSPTVKSEDPTLWVSSVTNSIVLHEFGHALGLVHEYSHPDANIQWNKEVVYRDLAAPPNKWDKPYVDKWVFEKFDASKEVITDFDPSSVMIYPIRKSWTIDGKTIEIPSELSDGDIKTIRKLYPA